MRASDLRNLPYNNPETSRAWNSAVELLVSFENRLDKLEGGVR